MGNGDGKLDEKLNGMERTKWRIKLRNVRSSRYDNVLRESSCVIASTFGLYNQAELEGVRDVCMVNFVREILQEMEDGCSEPEESVVYKKMMERKDVWLVEIPQIAPRFTNKVMGGKVRMKRGGETIHHTAADIRGLQIYPSIMWKELYC